MLPPQSTILQAFLDHFPLRGLLPERLCGTFPPIECVWHPRRSSQLGLHLLPSTSPGVTLPSSPGEAPRRSPQNRQMSSSSEKNSSSSSSAEAKLVKSTLYLNRPPIPPNPLTNCAPSCERFVTNSRFAPNSLYFSANHSSRGCGSWACSISRPVDLSTNFSRSFSCSLLTCVMISSRWGISRSSW